MEGKHSLLKSITMTKRGLLVVKGHRMLIKFSRSKHLKQQKGQHGKHGQIHMI